MQVGGRGKGTHFQPDLGARRKAGSQHENAQNAEFSPHVIDSILFIGKVEIFLSQRPLNLGKDPEMRRAFPIFALAAGLMAALPARADVAYLIDTAAGSDLVGDGGSATSAQL